MGNPNPPTGKTSPSLEVISSPRASGSGAERRRLPRLNLSAEQFRLKQGGKIFSVVDLSSAGMALRLLDQQDFYLFPVGMRIEGILNLAGEKLDVSARVRHLGSEKVGCELEELSSASRQSLERFLDPSRLGAELRPIPSSEEGTLWFQGPSGTDLLVKQAGDGRYERMTLYVLGSFIQCAPSTPSAPGENELSTGRVRPSDEQSEPRGVMRFETLWLDADAQPDSGKLSVAKRVILSSNLAEDLKNWCIRQLEKA